MPKEAVFDIIVPDDADDEEIGNYEATWALFSINGECDYDCFQQLYVYWKHTYEQPSQE
jgi:hypothetical protein